MSGIARITKFDPAEFEGFVYREPKPGDGLEPVQAKLQRYREAANGMLTLVADWDDTIADGTWPVLRTLMTPGVAKFHRDMYEQHKIDQREDTLSPEAAQGWQQAALGCLVGLKMSDIVAAARNMGLRPGAREIFEICEQNGITTIVKTGAVKQFVEAAAEANGIKPDLVIATDLYTNEDGTVTGWDPDSLTHSVNKGLLRHDALDELQRQHTILIGDGLSDRRMVPPEYDALLIRANGGFEDDDAQILRSFNVERPYDIVAVEPDLLAVAGLVDYLVSPHHGSGIAPHIPHQIRA